MLLADHCTYICEQCLCLGKVCMRVTYEHIENNICNDTLQSDLNISPSYPSSIPSISSLTSSNTLSSMLFVTAFAFMNFFKKESFDREENMDYLSFILHSVSWVSLYSDQTLMRMQVNYMLLRECVCMWVCPYMCISLCVCIARGFSSLMSPPQPLSLRQEQESGRLWESLLGFKFSSNQKRLGKKKKGGIT